MSSARRKEDTARIEAEVLDEIKRALNVSTPPATITIPKVIQSQWPTEASGKPMGSEQTTASVDSDSLEDHEMVMLSASSKRFSQAGSSHTDSFAYRLSNMSMGSSAHNSLNNSERFFIGTMEQVEEEGSIQSKVSGLDDADEMSYDELMELVHKLYETLKQSDSALASERSRRQSREKSLIKLAKELTKRKEVICKQLGLIEDLKDRVRRLKSEKSSVEQRLQQHVDLTMGEETPAPTPTRGGTERALSAARRLHKKTCAEHEQRLGELKKAHAKQCEQLCREVLEANQEAMRLRRKLVDQGKGEEVAVDRSALPMGSDDMFTDPSDGVSKQRKQRNTSRQYMLFALLCGTYAMYKLDGFSEHGDMPGGHLKRNIEENLRGITSSLTNFSSFESRSSLSDPVGFELERQTTGALRGQSDSVYDDSDKTGFRRWFSARLMVLEDFFENRGDDPSEVADRFFAGQLIAD